MKDHSEIDDDLLCGAEVLKLLGDTEAWHAILSICTEETAKRVAKATVTVSIDPDGILEISKEFLALRELCLALAEKLECFEKAYGKVRPQS